MKFTTPILVLSLTASAAMAQSVMAPINKAREAAAASSARTAESTKVLDAQQHPATPVKAAAATTAAPAKAAVPAKAAPAKPAAAASKTVKTTPSATPFGPKAPVKPASNAPATSTTEAAAAPAPEMKKTFSERGKRDPFLSIIRTDKVAGEPCLSGKKCLVIGDVILRGVVKSSNAVIAVVENAQHKTYFLHEDDPVFNGQVVKITPDSVVFREHVTDRAGHPSTREITKRLNARPIA